MLWLYRALFLPGLLVAAPRYLGRMRRRGGYRAGFGQRFGRGPLLAPKSAGRPRVWLQAVSVGEMLAIGPILEALWQEGAEIVLTTTTSTGMAVAHERYRRFVASLEYFPLDWWPFSSRAWRRIQPDLVILAEGERWPEHLQQAARRQVPVLCLNARLSDRSFARLRRFRWFAPLLLGRTTRFLAASSRDAGRLLELGLPPDRVVTTGNIKLDVRMPTLDPGELAGLQRELGLRPGAIILGSSTWPGEEQALVAALRRARAAGIPCSLLLVPRHAERRGEITALLAASGLEFHLRSRGAAPGIVDVAVADTTGELRRLTLLASLVFVGKSLPPHTEGQTPVEAAAAGKALLLGPGMTNFHTLAAELKAQGAAREVADAADLAFAVTELFRDTDQRERLAAAAAGWHRANRGAITRTLQHIRTALGRAD
jgi:3-deoxy-D-manno-octulosonic-acid transferase